MVTRGLARAAMQLAGELVPRAIGAVVGPTIRTERRRLELAEGESPAETARPGLLCRSAVDRHRVALGDGDRTAKGIGAVVVVRLRIPVVSGIRENQSVRKRRADPIRLSDGQHDVQDAIEEVDVIEIAEFVDLVGLKPLTEVLRGAVREEGRSGCCSQQQKRAKDAASASHSVTSVEQYSILRGSNNSRMS